MSNYIDWSTNSGSYRYWTLPTPYDAKGIQKVAGNYMFVKQLPSGVIPIYIGVAEDLSTRIPHHDRWHDAKAAGATAVMAHTNQDASARLREEADLVAYWNPPLNTQHRTT